MPVRDPARPTPPQPPQGAPDPASACAHFGQAAAAFDTTTSTTGTLGQARQTAARAFGTPQLQALFSGAGEGRNREQQTWQQHPARVTATAVPVVNDHHHHDEHSEPGTRQRLPGTTVAVTVTGTARGTNGWTAATAAYRLDCLTVQAPVAGWLVDDVAVTVLPPAPPAG